MKLIKVAAGVLNQTPLDWNQNQQHIVEAIERARQSGVSILCLPELCVTGYGCEDAFYATGVHQSAIEMLVALTSHTRGMVVSVGVPLMYAGALFNTACLLVDGRIAGLVAKQHLAGDGIHYEPRWFKPWPEGIAADIELAGVDYPIGDLIFDVGGVRIGFEICEDAWVGTRPGSSHAARGADLILNPSASHFAFGKHRVRRRFVIEGSRAFQVSYVYANLVGNESGRAIYDGDAMIASNGELVAVGKRFSYRPVSLTSATVDIDMTRMVRARTGSFTPDVDGDESDVIEVDFEFPSRELEPQQLEREPWESSDDIKFEEFTRSVSLGLFDYMRKSRSRGFVVSLSGGADSTSVVVLIHLMLRIAERELGLQALSERIAGWLPQPAASLGALNRALITTVYQATRNSSETTRLAAATVAGAVGSNHLQFDVDALVQDYQSMVSGAINRPLSWERDDIALQNIQSRVRSPGVWMIANLHGALLLSTCNRSESAVGYTTMDGDTSGGLAPIAGIDKAFLGRWLRWVEQTGPSQIGNIPEVRCVTAQQPTAELRPAAAGQTDEGDLMPYEILDVIERLAIRDKKMPLEVYHHIKLEFEQFDAQQLGQWTIRFFRLWCRNQWKRERYAPSFHLDDENLDPKTWCRFPILSGGYEREIQQLQQHLARSESLPETADAKADSP